MKKPKLTKIAAIGLISLGTFFIGEDVYNNVCERETSRDMMFMGSAFGGLGLGTLAGLAGKPYNQTNTRVYKGRKN